MRIIVLGLAILALGCGSSNSDSKDTDTTPPPGDTTDTVAEVKTDTPLPPTDVGPELADTAEDTAPEVLPDTPQDTEPPGRPVAEGPYGTNARDLAGPFTVQTLRGEWVFEDEWTGKDSYVFVVYAAGYDYSEGLWSSSMEAMLANSPKNVHYFFMSYDDTAEADVEAASQKMGGVLAAMPAADQAHWADRLHFVPTKAWGLDGWLGDAVKANGWFVYAIDRYQRLRSVGLLYHPGVQNPSAELKFLTHEATYFNFEWDRDQALAAEPDVLEVPVFLDENVGKTHVDVTFPDPETLAQYDTLMIDLKAHCTDSDEQNCGEWDYLSYLHLCDDPEDPDNCPTEVARWITTYGREGRWVTDISQMLALLPGGDLRFHYNPGYAYDTDLIFRFSNRGKGMRPAEAHFLWPGEQYFDENYNEGREPIEIEVPDGVKKVELYALITGHGFGVDKANCAEFCNHTHHFFVNGQEFVKEHPEAGTAEGCMDRIDQGVVPNQFGTWPFGRGGWCPGWDVLPFTADVTVAIEEGTNTLEYLGYYYGEPYTPEPYQSPGGGFKGGIRMSSWLIYWK